MYFYPVVGKEVLALGWSEGSWTTFIGCGVLASACYSTLGNADAAELQNWRHSMGATTLHYSIDLGKVGIVGIPGILSVCLITPRPLV